MKSSNAHEIAIPSPCALCGLCHGQGFKRESSCQECDGTGLQPSFQKRVTDWMFDCFGTRIAQNHVERNHRFLEESLELVQSIGCTRSEAHQLVDYVFSRPVGESNQEVGGTVVTLAALCNATGLDMHRAGEIELHRISNPEMMRKIREKQAAKPENSPLPQAANVVDPLRDNSVMQDDLKLLLDSLGLFSGARPQSPHQVMLEAIREVQRLSMAKRVRIGGPSALSKERQDSSAIHTLHGAEIERLRDAAQAARKALSELIATGDRTVFERALKKLDAVL